MRRIATSLALVALAAVFISAQAPAKKKPVTLESLSSMRMPSFAGAPNWAPDGKRFVYTEARKLWLYDVPSKTKKELAPMEGFDAAAAKAPAPDRFPFENRGVRERPVQWAPSGRELLVSAGGDLFWFRMDAGGWTQLTETAEAERDPKLSPDGTRVSFRRGHDLYVMEIATRKVTRLTEDGSPTLLNGELDWVYPEELDLGTAHWWSPDSKRIAYLQFDVSREPIYPQADLLKLRAVAEPERYPQAGAPNADVRLGVVAAAGGPTRWMDIGQTREHLVARVFWTPDSASVTSIKLNRVQNRLDLLAADPATGASRSVLKEEDPHWINLRIDPKFLKGGREFLWASERDGFNHLYRYSLEGRELGRLTSGDWEVTELEGVDERSGQVFFSSTEASPIERQLYKVSLEGGARTRLTPAAGTHTIDMSPTCDYYLDSHSSLTSPSRRTLHKSDGSEWAVYSEADRKVTEEYDILPSEIIEVKAADGATMYGRLIKPAGFKEGVKYPMIVSVYGGPHSQGVRNAWSGSLSLEQVLAHRGYVVWTMDNRGTFNRGKKFETVTFRNLGAIELEDQKRGIQQLVSMGFVDPARIGIHGWSYGGYMTLFSLLNAPDTFAAGIAGAPVTHWRNYDTIYTERYMGLPSENVEGYKKSAPLDAASNLKGKLLIAHNLEDDNVLFQNTVQMVDALQRAGKQFELMFYGNKSHGLSMPGRRHFNQLTVEFFDRALKKKSEDRSQKSEE